MRRSYSLSAAKQTSRKSRRQNRNHTITTDSSNYSGSIILNAYLPDQLPSYSGIKDLKAFIPSPRVPVELLDRIVTLILARPACPTPSPPSCRNPFCTSTNNFQRIAAFSLASSCFRHVALRRWFQQLQIDSERHCINLNKVITANDGGGWVRSISFPSIALTPIPTELASFTFLCTLSIDFSHDGLVTQYPVITRLFQHVDFSQVTTLTLTALPRIDVPILKLIASTIPKLDTLELSSTERLDCTCCEDCFNESASRVIHSPIPDMFANVGWLAHAFAQALKPLKSLAHLYLGFFLSHEKLLNPLEFPFPPPKSTSVSREPIELSATENPEASYESTSLFITSNATTVHHQELAAAIILAQSCLELKSLRWGSLQDIRIKFSSEAGATEWKAGEDLYRHRGDAERVWILREHGIVKVRKATW